MPPFPKTGLVRLHQIIGNKKADPPEPGPIPISASSWWAGVASGRYPKGRKLGPGTTVWHAEDVHELIQKLKEEEDEE